MMIGYANLLALVGVLDDSSDSRLDLLGRKEEKEHKIC